MPHTRSAKKRHRQDERLRIYNRSVRRTVKTYIKRYLASLSAESLQQDEGKKKAEGELNLATKKLDQAVAKGVIHKNTAARKKSQLQRAYNEALKG